MQNLVPTSGQKNPDLYSDLDNIGTVEIKVEDIKTKFRRISFSSIFEICRIDLFQGSLQYQHIYPLSDE